jgi:hypothetical protein
MLSCCASLDFQEVMSLMAASHDRGVRMLPYLAFQNGVQCWKRIPCSHGSVPSASGSLWVEMYFGSATLAGTKIHFVLTPLPNVDADAIDAEYSLRMIGMD